MNKLTAEVARMEIGHLREIQSMPHVGLSLKEEKYLKALEIALPVLEQQDKLLNLMPPSYCIKCDNTGQMGSGGTQPWGDAIMVTCDCQAKPSTTPQIDNDGWIEWKGGINPLGDNCLVKIRLRDTVENEGFAGDFTWRHGDYFQDIIAYRVIENDGREG